LAYSIILGGDAVDQGHSIAIDSAGDAYVSLDGTSLNPPVDADAALLKIAPGGQPLSLSANSLVNAAS
jgi:hypothetical protein